MGSTGWADNTSYTVEITYAADRLQVSVDGTLEIDIAGTSTHCHPRPLQLLPTQHALHGDRSCGGVGV